MSEKQDNTVKINDKDYKLDDLTSKAKYFLGQVKDLEKKISQSKKCNCKNCNCTKRTLTDYK